MQLALQAEGWCPGPLFAPPAKRPAPKHVGSRLPGVLRRCAERRATPAWVDRAEIGRLVAHAEQLTRETGVVHSVDHIVPLNGGTVCGLHWHGNMEIKPLAENMRKGARWWPDMWGQQDELFV